MGLCTFHHSCLSCPFSPYYCPPALILQINIPAACPRNMISGRALCHSTISWHSWAAWLRHPPVTGTRDGYCISDVGMSSFTSHDPSLSPVKISSASFGMSSSNYANILFYLLQFATSFVSAGISYPSSNLLTLLV